MSREYVKKGSKIMAKQWFGEPSIVEFIKPCKCEYESTKDFNKLTVAANGVMLPAYVGDYIIKYSDDTVDIMTPDKFHDTFDECNKIY